MDDTNIQEGFQNLKSKIPALKSKRFKIIAVHNNDIYTNLDQTHGELLEQYVCSEHAAMFSGVIQICGANIRNNEIIINARVKSIQKRWKSCSPEEIQIVAKRINLSDIGQSNIDIVLNDDYRINSNSDYKIAIIPENEYDLANKRVNCV
jgi:hypothetical protein